MLASIADYDDVLVSLTANQACEMGEFILTVKDVPVDGFWLVSIYNKDGYYEENKFSSYNMKNVIAKVTRESDVSY